MLEQSTIQIFVEYLKHFITLHTILRLEPLFPDMLKLLPCMAHCPVKFARLRRSSPVVLALISYLLPGISSYDIPGIEKCGGFVVSNSVADGHNHSRQQTSRLWFQGVTVANSGGSDRCCA